MAGHDTQDLVAQPLHLSARPDRSDLVEDIPQQPPVISAREQRRHCLDDEGPVAEVLDDKPDPGQLGQIPGQQLSLGRTQFDLVGEEELLDKNAARVELVLQLFEQDPFVGRVLVDERRAFARLGDDEGVESVRGEQQCGARNADFRSEGE
jgi:hypothetical protein